jgi:hypothetical protein
MFLRNVSWFSAVCTAYPMGAELFITTAVRTSDPLEDIICRQIITPRRYLFTVTHDPGIHSELEKRLQLTRVLATEGSAAQIRRTTTGHDPETSAVPRSHNQHLKYFLIFPPLLLVVVFQRLSRRIHNSQPYIFGMVKSVLIPVY